MARGKNPPGREFELMVGKNDRLRLYGELLNAGCAVSFR